jgi:hypothetical protein
VGTGALLVLYSIRICTVGWAKLRIGCATIGAEDVVLSFGRSKSPAPLVTEIGYVCGQSDNCSVTS